VTNLHKLLALCLLTTTALHAKPKPQPTVATDGTGKFRTLQAALDALPPTGGTITFAPGTYREKITIDKPAVQLLGLGKLPQDVVLVFDASAGTYGGTSKSATITVTADDFQAHNLTIQNDWSLHNPAFNPNGHEGAQAVALMLRGDRAIIDHVRLLGAQDTLYAGGGGHCSPTEPCRPIRQFFSNCYIEGHIDFIFGDANAVFQSCEIHGIANQVVWLTAQSKNTPDRDSAYIFDHCTITADPGVGNLYLGRPWRPYATVIYMNTNIDANLNPEGWSEWTPGKTNSIETAYYAEFNSTGRGGDISKREKFSHQLTPEEAQKYIPATFLAGPDNWHPPGVFTTIH
jgi:pectinesterase